MQSDPTIIRESSSRYTVHVYGGTVRYGYSLKTGRWEVMAHERFPNFEEAHNELMAHLKRTGEQPAIMRGSGMHG